MESLNIRSNLCHTEYGTTVYSLYRKLFMQDNQKQTLWAYIAGVMDSDGCFMITRHNRKTGKRTAKKLNVESWSATYMASVKVTQIEKHALNYIFEETRLGTLRLEGTRLSRPNSNPIWNWGIRKNSDVIIFLEQVIPWLKIKKERAEFLLNYCKTIKHGMTFYYGLAQDELNYREDSYKKMRKFNDNKVAATTNPLKCESISDSLDLQETVRE